MRLSFLLACRPVDLGLNAYASIVEYSVAIRPRTVLRSMQRVWRIQSRSIPMCVLRSVIAIPALICLISPCCLPRMISRNSVASVQQSASRRGESAAAFPRFHFCDLLTCPATAICGSRFRHLCAVIASTFGFRHRSSRSCPLSVAAIRIGVHLRSSAVTCSRSDSFGGPQAAILKPQACVIQFSTRHSQFIIAYPRRSAIPSPLLTF